MITCDLIGRLGNHMFQIATTIATAKRIGTDYAFPTHAIGSYTGEVYFRHLPVIPSGRKFKTYKEPTHSYKPIPTHYLTHEQSIRLHGYWQCEKYFEDYRDEIIDILDMRPPPTEAGYCSLHIRLGDYVQYSNKHPPLSGDYINVALSTIHQKMNGNVTFVLFSDDMNSAMELLNQCLPKGVYSLLHCNTLDPKASIRFMASMEHNIIANSSFSWWGAWLNPNPNKIVVAPHRWFGPGNAHLSAKDIYCKNWIVL